MIFSVNSVSSVVSAVERHAHSKMDPGLRRDDGNVRGIDGAVPTAPYRQRREKRRAAVET